MSFQNFLRPRACQHAGGFVPVIFKKLDAVTTAVVAIACPMCNHLVQISFAGAPKPPSENAAPPDTPAGVHAMPNGAGPK